MDGAPVVLRLQATDEQRSVVDSALADLEERAFLERLWKRDPSLWKEDDRHATIIGNALGWLTVPGELAAEADAVATFADEVRADGIEHVVLLGMGGSSLAPETLTEILGAGEGYPELCILDSTDPDAVLDMRHGTCLERRGRSRCCPRGCEQQRPLNLSATLFVVASKSGGTVETASFHAYFYEALEELIGERAGRHFVAITDEGTRLEEAALEQGFRAVFLNPDDIGGRYSALSFFGMVPAALAGLDICRLLDDALSTAATCGPEVACADAPAVVLGAVIGGLARQGRDKLTLLAPGTLAPLGAWIEQLLAESTGKEGRGILPVDLEPLGDVESYDDDRLFVHLRLADDPSEETDEAAREVDELSAAVEELAAAGHPVVTITLPDCWAVGGQFFLWEVATAAAGAVLEIDPFDQPNVQESKDNTGRLLDRFVEEGSLADVGDDAGGVRAADGQEAVAEALATLFEDVGPGDYVCLQAYVAPSAAVWMGLEAARRTVRDRLKVATTAGYGPRFLHSTGQYHKGGPDTGVYVQLVADHQRDAPIPGRPFGFSVLERAQADGDLESLRSRGRRIVRVDLGADVAAGLETVVRAVAAALGAA